MASPRAEREVIFLAALHPDSGTGEPCLFCTAFLRIDIRSLAPGVPFPGRSILAQQWTVQGARRHSVEILPGIERVIIDCTGHHVIGSRRLARLAARNGADSVCHLLGDGRIRHFVGKCGFGQSGEFLIVRTAGHGVGKSGKVDISVMDATCHRIPCHGVHIALTCEFYVSHRFRGIVSEPCRSAERLAFAGGVGECGRYLADAVAIGGIGYRNLDSGHYAARDGVAIVHYHAICQLPVKSAAAETERRGCDFYVSGKGCVDKVERRLGSGCRNIVRRFFSRHEHGVYHQVVREFLY